MARANRINYGWDWSKFQGSYQALKWSRRDLQTVDAVIKMVPQRRAVVQAGGNLGIFAKRLAKYFKAVYTFEPDPQIFAMLSHNAPEPNIIKIQAAIGYDRDLISTSQVRRDGKTTYAHEGITHIDGPGIVPTIQIDDLALPACDLMYIDVEGWELHALRGAVQTVARCRPVLCVEINQNTEYYGIPREEVQSFVLSLGYRHVVTKWSDRVFVPVERAA